MIFRAKCLISKNSLPTFQTKKNILCGGGGGGRGVQIFNFVNCFCFFFWKLDLKELKGGFFKPYKCGIKLTLLAWTKIGL